jgi:membrane protease YdiL (CAAX protease family)
VLAHPPVAWLPLAVMGFLLALIFWITGSLLPCIALHAANNALVMSISLDWTWQVPLAVIGIPALIVVALAPIAKQRAPQVAA